jgi:thiol-disulfide isomerase/thioredoxin
LASSYPEIKQKGNKTMRAISKVAGRAATLALFGVSIVVSQPASTPDSVEGRWDASLISRGTLIPFRLDISGSGPALKGTFFDGFKPNDSTSSATFQDGKLVLRLDQYQTTITATLKDGQLTGSEVVKSRNAGVPDAVSGFQATRHVETATGAVEAPSISGLWEIPLDTPSVKGENAFRFVVQQNGPEVAASILRVDGDTGAYSGTYKDGKWVLSHFDGGRPGVIVVSLRQDGTLEIVQTGALARVRAASAKRTEGGRAAVRPVSDDGEAPESGRYAPTLIAYRPEVARAKGLPEPDNFDTHTTIRDPNQRFTFNFPDADGKLVSNEDPRFQGKVVLAIVTGTWCPNCHDEAQFLVQLDRKYRDQGLAIVALDFEEPEQQGNLERERAFVKHYGVQYTYLIAGAPAQMWEKVPQAVNLNSWPTTIFVGRDGLVKGIHTGFASPASGEYNNQLKEEFTAKLEKLLAEKPAPTNTTAAVEPGR